MTASSEARLLVEAVASVWPEMRELVTGDWSAFETSVLIGLRQLETAELQDTAAGAGIDQVKVARRALLEAFVDHPAAHRRLKHEIHELYRKRSYPSTAIAGAVQYERYVMVPVYFGTDRVPAPKCVDPWYTGGRGELDLGVAIVSIPDDREQGKRPMPPGARFGLRRSPPNPAQHVSPEAVSRLLPPAEFAGRASALTDKAPQVLIFIHGYNVTFGQAVCSAAQIAYDINLDGVVMLYSWPSMGTLTGYGADENNIARSTPFFHEFLRLVLAGLNAQEVHLLAHSMGNRLLIEALVNLDPAVSNLGQVIFAAPDVDAELFASRAARFSRRARRYTLYVSARDRALNSSQRWAKHPRAGQAGETILVVAGVDTVDAGQLDTGFMGHSYAGDNPSVLSDIRELMLHDAPPDKRNLRRIQHANGLDFWAFRR
jgi:esterase/lipase superfamily enzyme